MSESELATVGHCDLALEASTKEIMRVGSKSFSLAAMLFPNNLRVSARLLYSWCRYCDDQVDIAAGPEAKALRVQSLYAETKSALRGDPQTDLIFRAFQAVALKHQIPSEYALDLVRGMEMDVHNQQYEEFPELEKYCYHVAGTVGLMMVYIMGVSDKKALAHAVDLGVAMQLTNISRDIVEDAALGRCYLPLSWVRAEGLTVAELSLPENRKIAAKLVAQLLEHTERYYVSGKRGMKYLPLRAAIAVAVAANVYREIGRLVISRGERAWDKRAVVSMPRKIFLVFQGILEVLSTIPQRIRQPWLPCQLSDIWRPTWID